jgi:hypothetical protein
MANGNGNGDSFRITRATFMVIVAIGSPIAGLSVGGYLLREQVKINAVQSEHIRALEREAWEREAEQRHLREDVDELLIKSHK